MSNGAGRQGQYPAPRRRGRLLSVAAAVLLLAGATAITVGLLNQDQPPQPSPAAAIPAPAAGTASPSPVPTVASTAATLVPTPSPGNLVPEPTAAEGPVAPGPPAPAVPAPRPVHISIPSIDVQSELIVLGLNADGTLAVPSPGPDYDKAAWFDGSPVPGEVGPAVIEGHIDSAANGPSVFFNLGDLTPGDDIDIDRADGSTVHFTVDAVRSYPKDDFPTLQVYGNTTGPELRLITCGGEFDSAQGSYRNNTVVYAHQMT